MICQVVFTSGAEADLDDLEQYLATRFSERNAARYVDRIVEFCKSLALAPYRGASLNDKRPGLRTVGMERRVTIQFQVKETQVVILGVYYAGRSIEWER